MNAQFEKDVENVLEKIKTKLQYLPKGSRFISYYLYFTGESDSSDLSDVLVLQRLQEEKYIKILPEPKSAQREILEVGPGYARYGKPKVDYDFIEVLQPKFDNFFLELDKHSNKSKLISLKGKMVLYDDEKATILIDGEEFQIPPDTNQQYLCRLVFNSKIGTFIQAADVYEEMTGNKIDVNEKKIELNLKKVQDTMYGINRKIKKDFNTTDDLFSWEKKLIKRNF